MTSPRMGLPFGILGALLLGWGCADAPGSPEPQRYFFVPNFSSNSVTGFKVDALSGKLSQVSGTPKASATQPSAVASDSKGRWLFVAHWGAGSVGVHRIDSATGALTEIDGSPFSTGTALKPHALAVHPSGAYLYVAHEHEKGFVSGWRIDSATGALSPLAGSPYATGNLTTWVTIAPGGNYLYATSRASDQIFAFAIGRDSGQLQAVRGSPFSVPSGSGPYAVEFASRGKVAVVNHYASSAVSVFDVSDGDGSLRAWPGSPFSLAQGAEPRSLAIDPEGPFLFMASSALGKVLGYSLDLSSRTLDPLPGSPFAVGKTPRSLSVAPSGTYLLVSTDEGVSVYPYFRQSRTVGRTAVPGSPFASGGTLPLFGSFATPQ